MEGGIIDNTSESNVITLYPSEIDDVLDAGIELENDLTGETFHGNMGFPVYTYKFSFPSDKLDVIIGQNETFLTEFSDFSETQSNIMVLDLLFCGLLGIIIGICFVNIFKSR